MRIEKKDLTEIVRKIESPYNNIKAQMESDENINKLFKNTSKIEEYDLNKMIPKVSYDRWSICLYEENNKLYYIDEDEISEVIPTKMATFDEKYKAAVDDTGKVLTEIEEFFDYGSDSFCCGQSDDMKYYILFERAN